MGRPALIHALASFCYNTIPEATLHQLALILDETPVNGELTSTLRDVIPLVIGEYIKHGAKMSDLLDQLETIMRLRKPSTGKSSSHVGNEGNRLFDREEGRRTSHEYPPSQREIRDADTSASARAATARGAPPTNNSVHRILSHSTSHSPEPHRQETNCDLQGNVDSYDREPVYQNSSYTGRTFNPGETNSRSRSSVQPGTSRQDPPSQSANYLRHRGETQQQVSQTAHRNSRNHQSQSHSTLPSDDHLSRHDIEVNRDLHSPTPKAADGDYMDSPHSPYRNALPRDVPHGVSSGMHHRERENESLRNPENQAPVSFRDPHDHLSVKTPTMDAHHNRNRREIGRDRQSSIPHHGRRPDEGGRDNQSSAQVHFAPERRRDESPSISYNASPSLPNQPNQSRGSLNIPVEHNQRTPRFDNDYGVERHSGLRTPGPEGGRTVEFEPILTLLKLTCHGNAQQQTLEHYVHKITHSPYRAQADKFALELDVTLATQNRLAADLLVPVKPFVKHVVEILLRRGQSEPTRLKEIDTIQQELAAACSGTPYQIIHAAATLISYIPNDEDMSKTIQDVILGMLSSHLIISWEVLVKKITQLKKFPEDLSSRPGVQDHSSSSTHAYAIFLFLRTHSHLSHRKSSESISSQSFRKAGTSRGATA